MIQNISEQLAEIIWFLINDSALLDTLSNSESLDFITITGNYILIHVLQLKNIQEKSLVMFFTAFLQRLQNTLTISEKCCFLKNNQSLGKQ